MLDKYSNEISDCDILVRSFWLAQLPQKNELGVHVFNNNGTGGGGGSNDETVIIIIIIVRTIFLLLFT